MTTFSQDDTHNIHLCLQGNADAFEPLVRRYQNAAFAVAMDFLRDRTDAEDVVQDAFVAAYCKLSQLKEPSIFGSWLHRIVVNRCKEWSRRKRASRLVRVDPHAEHIRDEYPLAAQNHQDYIESLELWDEVERLPEHYRQVVNLYYYTGFSLKEIAAFLDIPESTARGRLYQSRIRLKNALSPQEKETIAMSQIDVTEDVQDVVCKIAREDFEETIDMGDVENIVLYCGVNTEVEIGQAEGDQVVIEGSKIALGLTEEEARSNLSALHVSHDQVDNYLETGPHEGELFLGISSPPGSENVAHTAPINKYWKDDLMNDHNRWNEVGGVRPVDVFPELQHEIQAFLPLPEPIKHSLGKSLRLTVHASDVRSIDLPRSALSENVERIFSAVRTDPERVYGYATYCHLSISVPENVTISVFRGGPVNVDGLNGSLVTYNCHPCQINGVAKDVYLLNSEFTEIRRIGGRVFQRTYGFGGGGTSLDYGMLRRYPYQVEGKMESIRGGVDIDIGCIELDVRDVEGDVSIYNRYGTTRLYQPDHKQDGKCRLRTVSGEIKLVLDKTVAESASLVTHSLCGVVKYEEVKDEMPLTAWSNNACWMSLGTTYEYANTDFTVITESGTVEFEVTKNGKHH
ncbi:MAG: sigma-70 family RNA polymerase sigma factor [Gemmatimonadetes bacterium]|nr:sigma-70 family RNA polymerase sigma factor [Gemmatimonadota bacterium]MYB60034.1 sigma-70 family RNA polymerase sigma factor [Gemmatimonadota bacterium]